jgi:hypothetical protein
VKAATQIARELLDGELRDHLQDPIVCPAVVFEEQLNVIFGHFAVSDPFVRAILPCAA